MAAAVPIISDVAAGAAAASAVANAANAASAAQENNNVGNFFSSLFNSTSSATSSVTFTQAQVLAILSEMESMGIINKSAMTPQTITQVVSLLSIMGISIPAPIVTAIVATA